MDSEPKGAGSLPANDRRSGDKTAKVLGLFMAALLVATAGCGSSEQARPGHTHIDRNNDGYCDEDGDTMAAGSGNRHYGSTFYGTPHYGGGTVAGQPAGAGHAATISGGTSARGGIGGVSTGSGG